MSDSEVVYSLSTPDYFGNRIQIRKYKFYSAQAGDYLWRIEYLNKGTWCLHFSDSKENVDKNFAFLEGTD